MKKKKTQFYGKFQENNFIGNSGKQLIGKLYQKLK